MSYHLIIIKVLLAATLPLWLAGCKKKASFDLAPEFISMSPVTPRVGDPVVITYRINNVGATHVPPKSYSTELVIDGSLVAFDKHGNHHILKPGKNVEYSMAPGFYHFIPKKKGIVKYLISVKPKWGGLDVNNINDLVKGSFQVN